MGTRHRSFARYVRAAALVSIERTRPANETSTIGMIVAAALLCCIGAGGATGAVIYTSVDYPGADYTQAHGVSGGVVVGSYVMSGASHGFTYDGSTYTTLDKPGAD